MKSKETNREKLNRWRVHWAVPQPGSFPPPEPEREHATFISCRYYDEGGWGPVPAIWLLCKYCEHETKLLNREGPNPPAGAFPPFCNALKSLRQKCPINGGTCKLEAYLGD